MTEKSLNRTDFDTHWKEIILNLFEDFIKFFLPNGYKLIDFEEPIEFLEQELHKIIADKEQKGKVINDKLVKVKLKNGAEKWILVHIEVQSSNESDFTERMFTYFYRIYDRYKERITAIAIYTGEHTPKNYDKFEYDFLGTKNTYQFNAYRVSKQKEKLLLQSKNPFALVVLASLYLIKSKNDDNKKYRFKRKLIRLAKEKNYQDEQIINLLRFINFIVTLPENLELKFQEEIISEFLKSKDMIYSEAQVSFINKIHLALYGETLEDKVKREESQKAALEKTIIIQNMIIELKLDDKKIAQITKTPIEIVKDIRKNLKKG